MSKTQLDLGDPDSFEKGFPHDYFREVRATQPLYWQDSERGAPGFWVVSKYEDIRFISKNPGQFVSSKGNQIDDMFPGQEIASSIITMDPPQHARNRKLVSHGFTPRRIDAQEPRAREIVTEIIDKVADKGECDFVTDISAELPLQVICELVGIPLDDRHKIFNWSNRSLGPEDPDYGSSVAESMVAAFELMRYLDDHATKRGDEIRDDLTSALLQAEIDGEKLNNVEFDAFVFLLTVAGNETTRNLISHGMLLLMAYPDAREELIRDPSLLPGAIEEMLRMAAPVMYFRRTATQDVEIRGEQIREGDKLTLWYPSANRDEEIFEDPDRFDIRRSPNEHLAFGVGQHFCLGSHLARLEIRVMFEELLRRLPDIELAGEVQHLRSHFIDGIKSMPVRFS